MAEITEHIHNFIEVDRRVWEDNVLEKTFIEITEECLKNVEAKSDCGQVRKARRIYQGFKD